MIIEKNLSEDDLQCLEVFRQKFAGFKSKRIFLYGLGKTTKLILDNVHDFNILGLMDRANISDTAFNKTVYTISEAKEVADVIVIVATPYAQVQIFNRISGLLELGIKIYGVAGNEWTEKECEDSRDAYFDRTLEQLKKEIDIHDVISFDIFDTLIMRKCHIPPLIFDEVGNKIENGEWFKQQRISAAAVVSNRTNGVFTIDDIYHEMVVNNGLDSAYAGNLRAIEIDTELANATQRADIVECFYYALEKKKQVILVSDMYLPSNVITMLLAKCGIEGYHKLYVSGEQGGTKRNGDLWSKVAQVIGEQKVLHIGDDGVSDGDNCKRVGFDTFVIKQSSEMLELSSLKKLILSARTTDDLRILGLIEKGLFNNAFELAESDGTPTVRNAKYIGYLFFGTLTLSYLSWLIEKTKENQIERILFISRDGYILKEAYENILKHRKVYSCEPEYFYTSRRIAGLAALKTEYDISQMLVNFDFRGSLREALFHMFGLDCHEEGAELDKQLYNWDRDELINFVIENYKTEILESACTMSESYSKYLENVFKDKTKKTVTVDLRSSGTNLYHLNTLYGLDLKGYNFLLRKVQSKLFKSEELSFPYLKDSGLSLLGKYNITSACDIAECIYTSPNGMLLEFENGQPVFEEITNNHRDVDSILEAQEGIVEFIDEFFAITSGRELPNITPAFADELFGILSNRNCKLDEELRGMFVHYEFLRNEFRSCFE